MSSLALPGAGYDSIGSNYAQFRRADPRIATQIRAALGDAQTALNVGAGTGSYEPSDRTVVAVEPSRLMISQRPQNAAPAIQGVAEALPFPSQSFDAAMATLTLHHWSDKPRGVRELQRVAPRIVIMMSFELELLPPFWLIDDYLPEITHLDYGPRLSPDDIATIINATSIEIVPVPHDCHDGFLCAYWRRPDRYLDPGVIASISATARLDHDVLKRGLARLAADLRNGQWSSRHRDLLERTQMDYGYRLIIADHS
jgi:SAM-dependent methyltransferase